MSLIMDSKDAPHPGAQKKAPDSHKTAVLTVTSLKLFILIRDIDVFGLSLTHLMSCHQFGARAFPVSMKTNILPYKDGNGRQLFK